MFEKLTSAERLIAQQFNDAPRELKATIALVREALNQGNKGLALKELRQAEKIVEEQSLSAEWQAELHAAWAFYHLRTQRSLEIYSKS